MTSLTLHPDRLFPADAELRPIARRLYSQVAKLPIISPHGHTDPRWFAENTRFSNATELLLTPDHYLFRMLCSQGIDLDRLGVPRADGSAATADPREAWRLFASHWSLFRGTPSRLWLDWVFSNVFGMRETLSAATADDYFDAITDALARQEFLPRALFERFNIEVDRPCPAPGANRSSSSLVGLPRTLLLSGAVAALVSCTPTDSRGTRSPAMAEPTSASELVPTLRVRVAGDTVAFDLTVANGGETAVTLTFATSQRYDFVVRDGTGAEVWRWSGERMFAQAMSEEAVPAGGVLEYHEVWRAPSPGGYGVEARLESTDHPVVLQAEFEVPA